MNFDDLLSTTNISASGLSAERLRMEVVANNIANAFSTRTPNGGPFRRQDVVFAAVLNERLRSSAPTGQQLRGVEAVQIVNDPSAFNRVFNPGHPDADGEGFVSMPNVSMPTEMVNLITASRAYEANLRVLQFFQKMAEQALTLRTRLVMAITPIGAVDTALAGRCAQLESPGSAGGGSFTKLIDHMLNFVSERQGKADQAVNELVLGKTENLHNVMLSVANAELSFRMILEIRNRLTEAYQEIMRMQV